MRYSDSMTSFDALPPSKTGFIMPESLIALGQKRIVQSGTFLFQQDDEAASCFYLEQGEVALRRLSRTGNEIEIGRVVQGEWFGEVILFASRVFPASAVAISDCQVREFRRQTILSSMDQDISAFFLSLLARKCLSLNHRIQQLTTMDTQERVARFLVGLSQKPQTVYTREKVSVTFTLPKKKRQIAIELGMAAETFSRTLCALESSSYIRVQGNQIEILSFERLQSLFEDVDS